MNSVFSFLRSREEPPGEEELAPETPITEAPITTDPFEVSEAEVFVHPRAMMESATATPHGVPSTDEVIEELLDTLRSYLPPPIGSLPDPGISFTKVEEKPTGLGNHVGQEPLGQFSIVLKGGRLDAVVRFQLWANTPNNVDQAIDDLHGRLLDEKKILLNAGFLRFVSNGSSLAEHIPSLNAWRRTADYKVLYEFKYTDADGAQSLITRIPIGILTDSDDESTLVTDEMVRWDNEGISTLSIRGNFRVVRLSLLAFVPGATPSDQITLTRTFDDATGTPSIFTTLPEFVTAVTELNAANRHAQITFVTLGDFLTALTAVGDPVTLGDWNTDNLPDSYQAYVLDFEPALLLSNFADRLELSYQGTAFDQVAVLYIQATS